MSEPEMVAGVDIAPFAKCSKGPYGGGMSQSQYWVTFPDAYPETQQSDSALVRAAFDADHGYIAQLRRVEALEAERRWVPVGERLPVDDSLVIASFINYGVMPVRFKYGKWFSSGFSLASPPTHWQYLPAPPEVTP